MTAAQRNKLDCICGTCKHDAFNTSCLWNKIANATDPNMEERKQVLSLMSSVCKMNIELSNSAKIKRKEEKCQKSRTTSKKSAK